MNAEITTLVAVFGTVMTAATPLLFAALGELVTEKSGVLNLGVEGMMLAGAVIGFVVAASTGSATLGVIAAAGAGAAISLVFGALTLGLFANQVATGLALTLFGVGLSALIGRSFVGFALAPLPRLDIPGLSDLPVIGPLLFAHDALTYLALLMVAVVHYFLFHTRAGLVLRAVGESHDAAHAVGYPVIRIRLCAVMFGGAMAGLGGVYLETKPKLFSREENAQQRASRGQQLGLANLWIRASERAISGLFSTVQWELRTPDGEPVTEQSPEALRDVMALLKRPYTPAQGEPVTASPRTGRGLSYLSCRHMGLSGGSFWYLSETELFGGTPAQILYINPARMMPATNDDGALIGWVMDPGGRDPVGFKTDDIIYFPLEEPDSGHLGTGLVESALSSSTVIELADRQAAGVLSSGGRLTGIVSPKEGVMPDGVFQQVLRDLRTITDMPDAAKRSLVLNPYTPPHLSVRLVTTLNAGDLRMVDRKSTRLNSSHTDISRMPSSA